MFHELVSDPGEHTPEELYAALAAELADAVESAGVDAVAARTDLDRETVAAVAAGDAPELTLEEAAALLAAAEDDDAESIVLLSRDALMMGMSQAVLDVEALAAEAGGDLEAREVQSKIEGRFPMTLREFALLHATIRARVR
ncbi:DUF5791 family protein [Halosegnis marinus]|uniref:DUF5791 family protein n=1 Tax=Halosegnis marinus TaxID=3034023 RepID=A0ABD5ZR63_9EURY|nr:DUF5791 family protein [Halosegnis sp. DT85]